MRRAAKSSGRHHVALALALVGLSAALGVAADDKPPEAVKSVIYTKDNAPKTPALEDLELRESVAQYGITWTFAKPAPVGQFVNGDWYVVGPVTVAKIDPEPTYGKDGRNGSILNLPPRRADKPDSSFVPFDSRIRHHRSKAELGARLPIGMKPGDSLVSTISLKPGEKVRRMVKGWGSTEKPTKTAAILTCMAEPQPLDAFRPAFADKANKVYYARNLRRELLPDLRGPKGDVIVTERGPTKLSDWVRMFQRPWTDVLAFTNMAPIRNMPMYGREVARASGIGALMLCLDFKPQDKEPLLINYVQVGVDLWGLVRAGHAGWPAHGGHHSGRKLPIVLAGYLLNDQDMMDPYAKHPKIKFQEDMQAIYGQCWTGARVVYGGHAGKEGIVGGPGAGRSPKKGWGAYEHLHPSKWAEHGGKDFMLGESYRRCCTSHSWIGEALAMRLMKMEKVWKHDAFFDYCDRWMHEDDTEFIKVIQKETGKGENYDKSWAKQGGTWDPFVDEMWAKYRPTCKPWPPDGWKTPRQGP
ncbi:MAG TPA: hypothetical protein VNA25_09050 [Phycisphaerae bacterium]|nr:hypothetical protein [Phycisphaerae bacterium]